MKDWKIRQEMYHRLSSDLSDDLNSKDIIYRDHRILKDIDDYIMLPKEETGWVYPAKSYVVAVYYAYWLSLDFGEDFYELLDDESLLYNNDPHFVKYSDDPIIYNLFIENLGQPYPESGVIPDIRNYYIKEFLIEQ